MFEKQNLNLPSVQIRGADAIIASSHLIFYGIFSSCSSCRLLVLFSLILFAGTSFCFFWRERKKYVLKP